MNDLINIQKLAVFDLDGTLWSVNSHYELLNLYYKTKFWTSFSYKFIAKIVPFFAIWLRNRYFSAVTDEYISTVTFPFDEQFVRLLEEKRKNGFFVLIVSNAPREIIVEKAAERLNCEYLCAQENKKLETVRKTYDYKSLFVCTDNKTDCDLLSDADDYYIVANKRNKIFFIERGFHVE